jgi:hypothetical protein
MIELAGEFFGDLRGGFKPKAALNRYAALARIARERSDPLGTAPGEEDQRRNSLNLRPIS